VKQNMGTADRAIRTVIGLLVGVLYLTGSLSGVVALVLGLLATIFILTSVVSFCPLYLPFKFSTKPKA
jgi:hypothetical protein